MVGDDGQPRLAQSVAGFFKAEGGRRTLGKRLISFDTETHLIKAGLLTPRMVCLTAAERVPTDVAAGVIHSDAAQLVEVKDGFLRILCDRPRGLEMLREWLVDDGVILIGHNIVYDFGVAAAEDPSLLPLIFDKFEKGLAHDTQTRMQMLDIATGELKFHQDEDTGDMIKSSYNLADLSYRLLKKWLKKKDTWRLKYALLDGVPLTDWPADAIRYAIDDAVTTLECYEAQETIAGVGDTCDAIPNAIEQHRAQWALHLMSMWGLRTDPAAVAKLKEELQRDFTAAMLALRPSGLLNITPVRLLKSGKNKGQPVPEKITKFMKAIKDRVTAAYLAQNLEVPLSDSGKNVSTNRKTLVESGDSQLKELAEAGTIGKLLNTYVPVLESGVYLPITPRYNVLVETGRTSCSKPNVQNPPRKGGVRECIVPREGSAFVFSDYSTLELCALAQVCLDILGYSEMAEALRRGEDLHVSLAAQMMKVSYEEAHRRYVDGDAEAKEYRQFAKVPNFGAPGGLSAPTMVEYAAGMGVVLTLEQSKAILDEWHRRWSEMKAYFSWISSLTQSDRPIVQLRSGRVRGGASYCAAANGFFQALAADGAKEALWMVAKECYIDKSSSLYGCRPSIFVHDEIIMEVPLRAWGVEKASRAADRLSAVMIAAMKNWIPDVPISCSPVMSRRWFKGAEAVRVNGLLVPSKPEKAIDAVTGKKQTKWVADLSPAFI